MKKVYESHELAYQRLKNHGASSWNEMYSTKKGDIPDHIGIDRQRFIDEILEKEWSVKSGKALEIGCGTGPLIRWITSKGFSGTGIDISETAIKLAKEQYKASDINFFKDDFCYSNLFKSDNFDFIIDGHCFHCIVEDNDRKLFIEKAHSLLKKDGVFTLSTMCSPINKKDFSINFKTQKIQNNILYVQFDNEMEGSKIFNGKMYMAQRKLQHWKDILKLVRNSGFEIKLFKYEQGEVFSMIHIAAKVIK